MGLFGKEKKSGNSHWLTGNLDRRKSSNQGIEGGLRNIGNKATDSALKGVVGAFIEDPAEAERQRRAEKDREKEEARVEFEIKTANVTSDDFSTICNSLEKLFSHIKFHDILPDEKTKIALRKIETGINQLKYLERNDVANSYELLLEKYKKRKKIFLVFVIVAVLSFLVALKFNAPQ